MLMISGLGADNALVPGSEPLPTIRRGVSVPTAYDQLAPAATYSEPVQPLPSYDIDPVYDTEPPPPPGYQVEPVYETEPLPTEPTSSDFQPPPSSYQPPPETYTEPVYPQQEPYQQDPYQQPYGTPDGTEPSPGMQVTPTSASSPEVYAMPQQKIPWLLIGAGVLGAGLLFSLLRRR